MEPIEPKAPENDFKEIRRKLRQALFEDYIKESADDISAESVKEANVLSETETPESDKTMEKSTY